MDCALNGAGEALRRRLSNWRARRFSGASARRRLAGVKRHGARLGRRMGGPFSGRQSRAKLADAAAIRHHAGTRRIPRPPIWRGARPIRGASSSPEAAISTSPSSVPLPPPSTGAPEQRRCLGDLYRRAGPLPDRTMGSAASACDRLLDRVARLEYADAAGGNPRRSRAGDLACFVGDADPLLERVPPPAPEIAADYWVIVHRDLRRAACVRAVIDWIQVLFSRDRDVLAGIRPLAISAPRGTSRAPQRRHEDRAKSA